MTDTKTSERIEATIRGTVQGVGFRWFIVRRASDLGLVGWTSNEPDGSVKVVAEGSPAALDQLLGFSERGSVGRIGSVGGSRPVRGVRGVHQLRHPLGCASWRLSGALSCGRASF